MRTLLARGPLAALALALLLPFAAGCDSDGGSDLTAAFFVGNWRMEAVADQNGQRDRTADVRATVDDLRATFRADGTFSLAVAYSGDIAAQTFTGTYVVSPTGQLVLTVTTAQQPLAIAFDVTTRGNDAAEFRASAALVAAIFAASPVNFEFVGNVVLTMARGGAGA